MPGTGANPARPGLDCLSAGDGVTPGVPRGGPGGPFRRLDGAFVVIGAALALFVVLPLLVRHAGLGWELGSYAGMLAALGAVALCAYPVRPREALPPAPLSIDLHRDVGFAVIGLSVVHAVVLLVVDPPVIEYLKPTAPVYQLLGLLALILFVTLGVTSTRGVRRDLWRSHRGFQAVHVVVSIIAVVMLAAHVIPSARYVRGHVAIGLYSAFTIGSLMLVLRARKGAKRSLAIRGVAGRSAFGRHARMVAATVGMACLCTGSLLPERVGLAMREGVIARSSTLPLAFPHEKHNDVNCLVCHHDYADRTGFGTCIDCHRSRRADLKVGIEARFHSFCLDCHRDRNQPFARNGPVAGCRACHSSGQVSSHLPGSQ